MHIDAATNERVLKLVYCGPGLSGKSTNLAAIRSAYPALTGEVLAVDLHSERTLQLNVHVTPPLATVATPTRLEIFTVPGQNYYAATRKALLTATDGVVFVADSRREALDENIEAMNEMLNNVRQLGLGDELPVVIQYNKQDLPTAVKLDQIQPLLNVRTWPSYSAVATQGSGVTDTLQAVLELVLSRLPVAPPPPPEPSSWLISCHRCQAMLEVPEAHTGMVYTCGVCSVAMEVVDKDRGLTRPPMKAGHEDSAYSMQVLPDPNQAALRTGDAKHMVPSITPAGGTSAGMIPVATAGLNEMPFVMPGYTIVERLDENVQGQRMRVRDQTGRTLRALVINAQLMRQPGYRDGLDSYARLSSQVKHPFILPMVGMSQTNDMAVFLSSDQPDYEPLTAILSRRRALAPPHAMGILRQVALGLEEAARHGVVHGWLRPDIVLVNPDGAVLLDELSVYKSHRYLVRELGGASAATEYFLAPEHLNDEIRSDMRSDMFMLGAILFRLLTGEGLVTGYNAHDALHKISTNGARSLRSVQPGISRDLDQFFLRLVSLERKDRFQNYRELVDLFDHFGGGAQRQSLQLTSRAASRTATRSNSGMVPQSQTRATGRVITTGSGNTANLRSGAAGADLRRTTGNLRRGTNASPGSGPRNKQQGSEQAWKTSPRKPAGPSFVLLFLLFLIFAAIAAIGSWFFLNQHANSSPMLTPPPKSTDESAPSSIQTTSTTVNSTSIAPSTPVDDKSKKPKLPGWMTASEAIPGSPAAAPTTVPAQNTQPSATNSAAEHVATLLKAEHFQEALALTEQVSPPDLRKQLQARVTSEHDQRRQQIEQLVTAATDPQVVHDLLVAPSTIWGMSGDAEWARQLGLRAAPAPVAASPPAAPEISPESRMLMAYSGVIRALANEKPDAAQQLVARLDTTQPDSAALNVLISTWTQRAAILAKAITENGVRLRLLNPVLRQPCNVTSIVNNSLTLTNASGTSNELTWSQISMQDQVALACDAANTPGVGSEVQALAVTLLLVGGNPTLAGIQLANARNACDPAVVPHFDRLVVLGRHAEITDLAQNAASALDNDNAKLYGECLDRLRRYDPAVFPEAGSEIQRLESLRSQQSNLIMPDHVYFSTTKDLRYFERNGTWQIVNGNCENTGDARLGIKNLGNIRGLLTTFTTQALRGVMTVDFRGARLLLDFAGGSWQLSSKLDTHPAESMNLIPRTANTLQLDFRASDSTVLFELNNGVYHGSVRVAPPIGSLSITVSGGATVDYDEINFTRMTTGQPISDSSQTALRQLGFEPLGAARLDPPSIVLPASSPQPSGISLAMRSNLAGLNFEAKGQGMLRVRLGNPDGTGQWAEVELAGPDTPLSLHVSWTANILTITDDAGHTLNSTKVVGTPSQVVITAQQEATIMSTPRPVIK